MRYKFETENPYYAKLVSVTGRPIENQNHVTLLRLTFLIYIKLPNQQALQSMGHVACRDLVIHPGVENDLGVRRYTDALSVENIRELLEWRSAKLEGQWVTILFGNASKADQRQPFIQISKADVANMSVFETVKNCDLHWVTPKKAANLLGCGENTIRRRVDSLVKVHGASLLQLTEKGRRKINLKLLEALLAELDSV